MAKGKKKKLLEEIVAAWEVLSGGRRTATEIEGWLINDMAPAINKIRKYLKKNDRKKEHVGLNDSEWDRGK